MNALTKSARGSAMVTAEEAAAIRTALKTSLYPGATDESVSMVLAYCQAAGLDPMTKPVHIVPMSVKKPGTRDQYEWRDVVMPGIELYRTKAHRTGEYAGQDEAVFGPTVETTLGGAKVRHPEWCRVTVYRIAAGQRVPFSATAYWLETYATAKRDSDAPNAMWKKRPFGQIEKCAEALALRKAFPEAVGAQPTAEEMEDRHLDLDDTPRAAVVAMPQARAIEAPKAAIEGQATVVEPETQKPAGETVIDLAAGPLRLLLAKARSVGIDADRTEELLLERFGRIDMSNVNDVLAQLVAA